MELNKDALKQAALQNNSEECNALRSLLLGLCQQCSISMQKANSYHELIFDELEARHGNTEYVDKVGHELSTMHSLIVQVLQELPPTPGERMNLAHLAIGVLDRYKKGLLDDRTIVREFDESAMVSADAFELQELLLNVLEGLDRLNQPLPPSWKVVINIRNFTRQEASMLRLKDAGAYCVMSVRPIDAPELGFSTLRPFSQCLEKNTQIPAIVVAQWCGSATHNNANLFFDEEYPFQSAVIILPQAPAGRDESSPIEQYRLAKNQGTKTILLVDDEDMIWDVLSDMLQELGYRVILAGDGQEAVQIYGSNLGSIDLVILDMLMPNMGGRETFFILKELDPDVKVLASSGYVSQEEIQDVMDSGAAGFLRKPYRMADLARKIQEIFQD